MAAISLSGAKRYAVEEVDRSFQRTYVTPAGETIIATKLVVLDLRCKWNGLFLNLPRCYVDLVPSTTWKEVLIGDRTMRFHDISPHDAVKRKILEKKYR